MSTALFRMMAGLCRSMIVANTGGTFALLGIFVLGGFLIPRKKIKPWWIWGYWISPLAYAQNGINVNEFLAPEWNKVSRPTRSSIGYPHFLNLCMGVLGDGRRPNEWGICLGQPYGNSPLSLGVQFLNTVDIWPREYWYWIAVGVMVGYTIIFNILFTLTITVLGRKYLLPLLNRLNSLSAFEGFT